MKKKLAVFLLCFLPSLSLLIFLAGGVRGTERESPLRVYSDLPEEPKTFLNFKNRVLELYPRHKIREGKYYHYEENSLQRNSVIRFREMAPWKKDELRFDGPEFTYYSLREQGEAKTPDKYEVRSKQGFLMQRGEEFDVIRFEEDVEVTGYESGSEEPVSFVRGSSLLFDLLADTVTSSDAVAFEHREKATGSPILQGTGRGMLARFDLSEISFEHLDSLSATSGIWQLRPARGRKIEFDRIDTRCDGKARILYDKTLGKIDVFEDEDVSLQSEQASLRCQHLTFQLVRDESESWRIEFLEARDRVFLEDGPADARNELQGEFLRLDYPDEKQGGQIVRNPRILVQISPRLSVSRFGGFSFLPPEQKERLDRKQRSLEISRLEATAEKQMLWRRNLEEGRGYQDCFEFEGNAHMEEIPQSSESRHLYGEKVEIGLREERSPDGKARRIPLFLDARERVRVVQEKTEASGDRLRWDRLTEAESKAVLTGSPTLHFRDVSFEDEGFVAETAGKGSAQERRGSDSAKKLENVTVTAQAPMVFHYLEHTFGNALSAMGLAGDVLPGAANPGPEVRCLAREKVRMERRESESGRLSGHFECESLEMGFRKKLDEKTRREKMDWKDLRAEGGIAFDMDDVAGQGSVLTAVSEGERTVTLCGDPANDACLVGKKDDARLFAPAFVYDTGTEIFRSAGDRCRVESPKGKLRGRAVSYDRRKELVRVSGPVFLEQEKKDGDRVRGKALRLQYNRRTETISFYDSVVLEIAEKGKKSLLTGSRLYYDKRKDLVQAFGNPVVVKQMDERGKVSRARGLRILYDRKLDVAKLRGEPAHVQQLDEKGEILHSVTGRQIEYGRRSGEIAAEGEVHMDFSGKGRDYLDLEGESSPESSKEAKGESSPDSRYKLVADGVRGRIEAEKRELLWFRTFGSVTVEKIAGPGEKQEKASGDWVQYDEKKNLVLHGNPAVVEYGGHRMSGEEFQFDRVGRELVCQKPKQVLLRGLNSGDLGRKSGERSEGEAEDLEILCEGPVRFFRETGEIEFHRKVKVENRQGKLFCELLRVQWREKEKKLDSMTAYQNVRYVTANGETVLADRLDWDEKAGIATLSGFPRALLISEKFRMEAPVVWYHIPTRRFFTRGREVLVERLPGGAKKKK